MLHEKDVEKKLREIGYEVEGLQKEFRLEKPLVTAHIDGMLRRDGGEWAPYDAKSVNPWDFDGLDSAEDFIHSKKVHQRNYPAQILLYMLATGCEHGCLILKNKQTGQIKDVWFDFNEHVGILDEALKRAERAYKAKDNKSPPNRTDDRSLCAKCDFKDICLPDLLANGGVEFINSDDLQQKLEKRETLKTAADEFNDLDEEIKKTLKETGTGEKAIGDFLITIKERVTTRKKPITFTEETTSYLTVNIGKIGGKDG
jgi:CRISPR/Cas system-associated exonuclease Cas4 (RecB family)